MRSLLHVFIVLSILVTAAFYATFPHAQLSEFWSKYHLSSMQFMQSILGETLFSSLTALPLWQALIGLTMLFYLLSRLFKA
jgi:hypothetical protein